MNLLLIQRLLPAYRQPLFEALRKRAEEHGHRFSLWVSPADPAFARRGTVGGLPWARCLPVRRFGGGHGLFEWQQLPWREVLAADVVVVPDAVRCLSHAVVILWGLLLGKPILTWGHGVNFQPGRLSRWLEPLRHRLLRMAQGHLLYTETCLPPMLAKGYPESRLRVVGNAGDTRMAMGLHGEHPEVQAFRSELGLGDAPCIAFLGSWYAAKQPERILAIGQALHERLPMARVLVIGGGDGLTPLRAVAANHPWLSLLGPLHGRRKFVALATARCLAVTGIAGLNLLDAMAVGLPVVLPARSDHSPEVAYVRHGGNGLVVADHSRAIAEACADLLSREDWLARLGQAARATAQTLTADRVAVDFIDAMVSASLATPLQPAAATVSARPVVYLCQHLLSHHRARFRTMSLAFAEQGRTCVAVQVSACDRSYGVMDCLRLETDAPDAQILTLFPGQDYLELLPRMVAAAVEAVLTTLGPDTVFSPAPAFAEGAGALHYKARHACRLILMDDAWSPADRHGWLTRRVKRALYGLFDGALLSPPLQGEYFSGLNIPRERQRYLLDVVEADLPLSAFAEGGEVNSATPYLPARRYSLAAHADAAMELAALPLRRRPPDWVSRLALAWPGRVAVY
ncbi:glycosyltransferase [Methyloparacoccus murrellii]